MSEENSNEAKIITAENPKPELTPEQKKKETKEGALGCLILIVLIAVGWYFAKGFFASEPEPEILYVTQEQQTQERMAENIVRDIWGAKTNWEGNEPRIISIKEIPQIDDTLTLELRLRVDEANVESQIILNLIDNGKPTMEKFFASPELKQYEEVRIYGYLPMVDKYGNVSEDPVAKLFMKRSLANKIAWKNIDSFKYQNILQSENAATYWIHPGIQKHSKF